MNVNSQQLNSSKWRDFSSHPKPYWLPLVAMLLLSLSFMQFFVAEPNDSGEPSGSGAVKFAMHIASYMIIGFVLSAAIQLLAIKNLTSLRSPKEKSIN